MKKILFLTFLFLGFLVVSLSNSFASEPKVDSVHYNWTVYEMDDLKYEKKCYIANFPKESVDNIEEDRQAYILITRYKGNKLEEISVAAGYEYKINSDVLVSVDDMRYSLFTHKDIAWSYTPEQDRQMIEHILHAKEAKVKADTGTNKYSVDLYDLKGAPEAYGRMKELCK